MEITENIRLFNVDCMEFMSNVPDKYYDLAIVDPPYGNIDAIGLCDNKKKASKQLKEKVITYLKILHLIMNTTTN